MKIVDFKQLSEWGLVFKINEVLHPLGLALSYDVESNISNGAYIAEDFEWEYPKEVRNKNLLKFEAFVANRIQILTDKLSE